MVAPVISEVPKSPWQDIADVDEVLLPDRLVQAQPLTVGGADLLAGSSIELRAAGVARGDAQGIEDGDRGEDQDNRHP